MAFEGRRLLIATLPLLALPLLAAGPAQAAPAEKKKGGGESYIQLPTVTATILRDGGARGVLTVDVGIDAVDPRLHARVLASLPLLRDAFVRKMLVYAPSMTPGAPPNADMIATELQQAVDQTLGRPGAKLLLGSIIAN